MNDELKTREQLLAELTALKRTSAAVTMKALIENEQRYRGLVERMASAVAVYEVRGDGREFIFKEVNRALEKIENARREDLLGRNVLEVFPGAADFGIIEVFRRVWQTGQAEHFPVKLYTDNRISGWRENFIYKLPSGEVVTVYDDLTKARQAEETLKASESRYRSVFATAGDAMFVLDQPTGAILDANRTAERLYGYTRDEFLALKNTDLSAEPDKTAQAIRTELAHAPVRYHKKKDGTVFPVELAASYYDWNGRRVSVVNSRDVSERMRADEELRKSRDLLRFSLENMLEGYALHEAIFDAAGVLVDYRFVEFNPAAQKISAIRREDIIGRTALELYPNIVKRGLMQRYARVMATGVPEHIEDFYYAGDRLDKAFDISCFRVDDRHFVCVFRDVTERRRSEAALRDSEFFFKESQKVANIGSYKLDCVTGSWESSEVLDRIFGIGSDYPRNVAGWLEIVHPDDREKMGRYLQEEVIARRRPFDREYRIVRKSDGETRWVHGLGKVDFDATGMVVAMLGTIQDITDRRRLEDEIARGRALLQNVIDSTSALIYVTDLDGKFILFNRALEKLFGVGRDAVLGRTRADALAGIMRPEIAEEHRRNDLHVAELGRGVECEERNVEADGEHVYQTVKHPLRDANGQIFGVAGVSTDITARKRLEAKLLESQRSLQVAQSMANIGDWEWNVGTETVKWSEQLFRIAGRDPELPAPAYAELPAFYTPASWARLERAVGQAVQEGEPYELELDMLRPDGEVRCTATRGRAERDASGRVVRLHGTVQDITEHRRAEALSREKDERLELAHRVAMLGNWEWNLLTNEIYWAESNYRIHGIDPRVKPSYEAFIQAVVPAEREFVNNSVAAAQANGTRLEYDYTIIRPDNGERRVIHVIAGVLRDSSGQAVKITGTVQDVTERKQTEERLQQQIDELQRWHALTLGREERVQELKREVNELRARLNEPPRYPDDGLSSAVTGGDHDGGQ